MRGTYGDTIQALEARRDILSTVAEGQRPPGGKPLERLLLLLASKGYAELATAAVESAVTEKATKQYLARIKGYPAGSEKPAGGKGKKSTEKSASAESIANEYLAAAGPPTGPPGGPGPQWRNLGPYTIPNGQTYGSSRINVSGRVAAIAVDPGNPAHVLCGAANGGVWERFNRGGSWVPRTDYGAAEILAACSDGLWRSTDGGSTWAGVALPGSTGGFDRLAVSIAPSNPLVAYAWASQSGTPRLWRRAVGTWTAATVPIGLNTGQAWYDWYVAAPPDRDNQVYIGAIDAYRGDLSGSTWTPPALSRKTPYGQTIH